LQEAATQANILVECNLQLSTGKHFETEFVKQCTVNETEAVCPKNGMTFKVTSYRE
jgi:hypothetical protein